MATPVSAQVQQDRDRWTYRRRTLWATLAFHAAALAYLLAAGDDGPLHMAIAGGLIPSGAMLVLGYVLGPIADDWLQRLTGRGAP